MQTSPLLSPIAISFARGAKEIGDVCEQATNTLRYLEKISGKKAKPFLKAAGLYGD